MKTERVETPSDCQLLNVSTGGEPLGWADLARQWTRRIPWAAVRRARRVAARFGGLRKLNGDNGAAHRSGPAAAAGSSGPPFQPGELVEVRGYEEIAATLDGDRKCDGLEFMEGMKDLCGRRLVVFKKVEMLFDEAAGRMLRVKKQRYVLEGAICDGRGTCQRTGCDRCCFYFWSRAWLKKTPVEK